MSETNPFRIAEAQVGKHVEALTNVGIRLSKLTHDTTDRVIRQQARIVTNGSDAVLGRLQAAADASDFKDFVLTQARLLPADATRLISDTRDAFEIMLGASAEVRDIVLDTAAELRGRTEAAAEEPAPAPAKKPRRKTAARTAASKKARAA